MCLNQYYYANSLMRRSMSDENQSNDLHCESIDIFRYDLAGVMKELNSFETFQY